MTDHEHAYYTNSQGYRRCRQCQRNYQREHQRRARRRLWAAAKERYGDCCALCGATRALTIDHIDGGGAEHRLVIGNRILRWLARNDYPPGFRILCFPCNIAEDTRRRESAAHL